MVYVLGICFRRAEAYFVRGRLDARILVDTPVSDGTRILFRSPNFAYTFDFLMFTHRLWPNGLFDELTSIKTSGMVSIPAA